MRWLALFFVLAFVGAEVLIQPLVLSIEPAGDHRTLVGMLIADVLLAVPATAVAGVLRSVVGRLTGFTAAAIGVISCLATVNLVFGTFMATSLRLVWAFSFAKFLGPMILAHVAFFRERALGWPAAGESRGLAGTHAFNLDDGESLVVVLARRSSADRRWTRLGLRVPTCWDDAIFRLAPAPRKVPAGVAGALALRGRSTLAWWWFAAGFLALAATIQVPRSYPPEYGYWSHSFLWFEFALLFSALALLHEGAMRLVEATRLVHLLRNGEIGVATPQAQIIPGAWSVVATTTGSGSELVVETPRPKVVGARQGLLIDRPDRRVVAWDLLPYVPSVTQDGLLTTPPTSHLAPWLIGPMATLIAMAVLVAVLMRG